VPASRAANVDRTGQLDGGNAWAPITESLIELRRAMDHGDIATVSDLLRKIPPMEHNTGRVGDKLRRLDSTLGSR